MQTKMFFSERMVEALELADKCWAKARSTCPEFVEQYLFVAEDLLHHKSLIRGDEFREACRKAHVFRPSELHHNVWVSGVRTLKLIGWISEMGKVEPEAMHNHMPTVTLWRSNLYRK
ncbi:MAG: hypothetical protein EBR82_56890 [Caulobacteraceae bacterium]|nr:hypothetical protein [Caulobacteraceae bacterium]